MAHHRTPRRAPSATCLRPRWAGTGGVSKSRIDGDQKDLATTRRYHRAPMPDRKASNRRAYRSSTGIRGAASTLRLAVRFRRDPFPFWLHGARGLLDYLRDRGIRVHGTRALDAGTGAACIPVLLTQLGSRAIGLDLRDHRVPETRSVPLVLGRGERLPLRDNAFDLVMSSNVLEHTADPWAAVDELIRVCRPGGFVCLSWTNWLGPLGGHELSPFHYLGPRAALRIYKATRGRDPRNMPGRSLFPLHIGEMLRGLRRRPVLIRDIAPRYWPQFRFVLRVPGLREFLTWNCLLLLQKEPVTPSEGESC
jgi:SAM-dependent methyltransferase